MKKYLYIILLLTVVLLPKDVFAQDEWITENGESYYVVDGEKVTGIQIIDGKTYYFDSETGCLKKGFIIIDGKTYFFSRVDGALKSGWQEATEGKWYQYEDGEVAKGKHTIEDKTYYFDPETGYMKIGFIMIEGKLYFYSRANGALKSGWQETRDGKWYQYEDGEVAKGKQIVDGKTYYFDPENGYMKIGFLTIDGKLYFYSRANGALKTGWQETIDGKWYQYEDGEVAKGKQTIDSKSYYFDPETGYMKKGFITIEGKLYFYSRANGALKTGWQEATEGIWYQYEDGEVVVNDGIKEINGKEYYFDGKFIKTGIVVINDKKYYFDKKTYEKINKTVRKKYYDLVIDEETGEFIKKQYKPVYYMQKDSRWNKKRLGLGTFGMTGCAPTGMAMAYTSILGKEVLPISVGNYLYYYTDQFNRRLKGTSGMGIIYASNHYNVKVKGIGSKKDLREALQEGKIVYASMQNGKFAKPTYNHVIIMYDYDEEKDKTFTLDPLFSSNNEWTDIDLIWREQCMDPDDRTGGFALYSLEEK